MQRRIFAAFKTGKNLEAVKYSLLVFRFVQSTLKYITYCPYTRVSIKLKLFRLLHNFEHCTGSDQTSHASEMGLMDSQGVPLRARHGGPGHLIVA